MQPPRRNGQMQRRRTVRPANGPPEGGPYTDAPGGLKTALYLMRAVEGGTWFSRRM